MMGLALPTDTTREAGQVQLAAVKKLGFEGRARLISQLCKSQRRMMEAGVRHRHPEYNDDQVRLGAIRLSLGERLFRQAYPGIEVEP